MATRVRATGVDAHSVTGQSLEPLMDMREVAKVLQVGYATATAWCRQGYLPAVKIGKSYRIRRRELDAWYEAQRSQA